MRTSERIPLDPFPTGWYAVAFSGDLGPGEVRAGTWHGHELVLYRTASGQPVLRDAWCPHLGAHLGHGGTVVGEDLQCPFHRLRFDPDGRCVHNPLGKVPPTANSQVWPVVEQQGAIFAWFDRADRDPLWQLPELEHDGWTAYEGTCWPGLTTHPQETTENVVDMAHFPGVHGYGSFEATDPLFLDEWVLTAGYKFTRPGLFPGLTADVQPSFKATVAGLGYSLVEVTEATHKVRTRHLVLCTPTDGEHVELRVSAALQHVTRSADVHPLAAVIPRGLLTAALHKIVVHNYLKDVTDDHRIWSNKRHLTRPALMQGDGPIAPYRRWCERFYVAKQAHLTQVTTA